MTLRSACSIAALILIGLSSGNLRAAPSIDPTAVAIQVGNRSSSGLDIDLISTTDQPKMFNLANCECGTTRTVKVTISGASSFDGTVNVYYYIGPNCSDQQSRSSSCKQLSVHKLAEYFNQSVLEDIAPADVISPSAPSCFPSGAKSGANTFFVFIDWNGDQAFDTTNDTIQSLELNYDVEPPGTIRSVVVTPGEQALNVSWQLPTDTDIEAVQVLCGRGTLPVFPSGTYKPAYESSASVCPVSTDGGVADGGTGSDGGDAGAQEDAAFQQDASSTVVTDAGTVVEVGAITGVPSFGGLSGLDPAYLCSGSLGASTTSARIATLQNGVTYYVAVVAVDKSGNASSAGAMVSGTPEEVLDFWEDYKQQGGKATGCSLGPRVPLGWIGLGSAALLVVLGLRPWRRRGSR